MSTHAESRPNVGPVTSLSSGQARGELVAAVASWPGGHRLSRDRVLLAGHHARGTDLSFWCLRNRRRCVRDLGGN